MENKIKVALLLSDDFGLSLLNLRKVKPESLAAAVKIKKIFKKVEEEVTLFREVQTEACKELADKDTEGNPVIINNRYQLSKESNMKLAVKLQELANVEVDIDFIDISELGDLTRLTGLSAEDLTILEPILRN